MTDEYLGYENAHKKALQILRLPYKMSVGDSAHLQDKEGSNYLLIKVKT